ncbi:hypothetical protein [Winogradskyella flava]|uniref:Uncharacterized protein n=1 Tax=Winogradskyella flava TaxID=1884876 RepID=A0A842ITC9_9FLAO|nr:hypothetical protein [Winogradskyella flava]MBC2846432.1 hypothetical protein [Winogradskyella flava]
MAPIKFEEQLKDKLEKRSLQPSIESWSKLSERLDTQEKKSKNPWFWWMGIAAGVIIMIAIMVETFGSKIDDNTAPQIVEEESMEQIIEPKQPNLNEVKAIELAAENEKTDSEIDENDTKEEVQIINYKAVINKKQKTETQLASNQESEDNKVERLKDSNKAQQSLVKQTMINKNAVVEALDQLRSETPSVTDREVDSLLKLASKELFKDKLRKETSKTVDANSLLLDVEEEMGQSFRTKVYEALKESYETVKTAVAERNN